jgi:hypothetical protein
MSQLKLTTINSMTEASGMQILAIFEEQSTLQVLSMEPLMQRSEA